MSDLSKEEEGEVKKEVEGMQPEHNGVNFLLLLLKNLYFPMKKDS
jgi:hypothetical protein